MFPTCCHVYSRKHKLTSQGPCFAKSSREVCDICRLLPLGSFQLIYSIPLCVRKRQVEAYFFGVCVPFPSGWFTLPREQCGKHKPQLSSSSTLTLLSTFSHISMVSIQCVFVCLEHILKPKPKKFWFRFYLNKN